MAIGDDATAAGYPLVPATGAGSEVALGAQEINRTRDFIAQVKNLIPISGSTPATVRSNLGINSGTAAASDTVGGAVDGNIYFKIIP